MDGDGLLELDIRISREIAALERRVNHLTELMDEQKRIIDRMDNIIAEYRRTK